MSVNNGRMRGESRYPSDQPKEADRQYYEQLRQSVEAEFADIGIHVNEPGFEKTKSGKPRFFEMAEDGTFRDAFQDGVDIKSDQFLDKISKGNLFTFPAGSNLPVQITTAEGKINFSKPFKNLPASPEPQRPAPLSGWKRFANAITFGRAYRKERADYEAGVAQYQKHEKEKKAAESIKSVHDSRTNADVAAEEKSEWARDMVKGKQAYSIDIYQNTLVEYFGPKPVFHEEFCKEYGGKSYEEADFRTLQDYSGSIRAEGERQISDKEFTVLSMMNMFDPEITGDYDPAQGIGQGLTKQENVYQSISMFTDTLNAHKVTSRPAHSRVLPFVQKARAKSLDAVQAYQKTGDPEKLGQQLGEGLYFFANNMAGKPFGNEHHMSVQTMTANAMNLLERDPKLMEKAKATMLETAQKQNPNATKEELNAKVEQSLELAKGQRALHDLTCRNEKAKAMLEAENMGFCKLTPEQKKGYIDDRVAFETLSENTQNDLAMQEKSEQYKQRMEELDKIMEDAQQKMRQGDANALRRGMAQYQYYQEIAVRPPKAFALIGKNGEDKVLDRLVNARVPNREALYKLSGKELTDALEPDRLLGEKSPYTKQPEAAKTEPQPQKEKNLEQKKEQGIGFGF